MTNNLSAENLKDLYLQKNLSAFEISKIFNCSENKINHWLKYYNIQKRSISDAIYLKHNPNGDPFSSKVKLNAKEKELKALGLGIYWGEGDKSLNNTSVRLGNTDPYLLKRFREFLRKIYCVKEEKIKYGLILFNDANERQAVHFWKEHIEIRRKQLGKITKIAPQGKGTYKRKSRTGVFIINFTNKKLKEIILKEIQNLHN